MLDLAAFYAPPFRIMSTRQTLECLQEQMRRRDIDDTWRSYMALVIPALGGKDVPTYEEFLEKYKQRMHVVTKDEIQRAEDIGRETAAAFGLL